MAPSGLYARLCHAFYYFGSFEVLASAIPEMVFRGHPRSSETSPFDRAHMTSYSTLIETTRLSCIARFSLKVTNFNPPYLHLSPPYGMIPLEFRRDIWHQKTRFLAGTIVWHYLRDPTFSTGFDTILECVRQTERQTHRHTTTAYTA